MDNPNTSCNLRRRNSLPVKFQIRTTSLLIKRRLQKTNPYVGSFRHAPPTTFRSCFLESPVASVSPSSFSSNLHKRSPYVGWFRHAPPASRARSNPPSTPTSTARANLAHSTSSIANSRRPHRYLVHPVDRNELLLEHFRQLALLVSSLPPSPRAKPYPADSPLPLLDIVNGRLPGGAKDEPFTRTQRQSAHPVLARIGSWLTHDADTHMPSTSTTLTQSSSPATSVTRPVVPLQRVDEEDSYGPPDYTESDRDEDEDDDAYSCYDYGGQYNDSDEDDGRSDDDSDCSSLSSDDTSNSDDVEDNYGNYGAAKDACFKTTPSKTTMSTSTLSRLPSKLNKHFGLSLAEIAETCYPASIEHATAERQGGRRRKNSAGETETEHDEQQLDYVITQMDIARMARNASRHLDVDSILKLPTITYRTEELGQQQRRQVPTLQDSNKAVDRGNANEVASPASSTLITPADPDLLANEPPCKEGWSWMMVKNESSFTYDANARDDRCCKNGVACTSRRRCSDRHHTAATTIASSAGDDEFGTVSPITDVSFESGCVICMEPFLDGDRLRVLPCDHLFHVGCIDRWLAGSHSFEECFTNGCPTCKKQASSMHESTCSEDGSVPSWAFAQLGSVLARQASSFQY